MENLSGILAFIQSLAILDTIAKEIIDKLPDDLLEERKREVKNMFACWYVNILVIKCSPCANNVVITTGGFGFAVRPNCY